MRSLRAPSFTHTDHPTLVQPFLAAFRHSPSPCRFPRPALFSSVSPPPAPQLFSSPRPSVHFPRHSPWLPSLPPFHRSSLPMCRTSCSGFWGGFSTLTNWFIGCGVLVSRGFYAVARARQSAFIHKNLGLSTRRSSVVAQFPTFTARCGGSFYWGRV